MHNPNFFIFLTTYPHLRNVAVRIIVMSVATTVLEIVI